MIKHYELIGKNYNNEDSVICLFSGGEDDLVVWLRAMIEQGLPAASANLELGEISAEQYKTWQDRKRGAVLSKSRRKVIDLIK